MQEAGLPNPERVRAVFEEVLAASEFQYADASPLARWWNAFIELVANFLRRWWPELGDTQIRLISWIALAAATTALLLMLSRWASHKPWRAAERANRTGALARPRDAESWAEHARAAAAEGRYREAATGLYQATVLHLDSVGSIRYREWKTPGDYAVEVSGRDVDRRGFVEFLSGFVELAFGPREPGAAAFEALSARAGKLGSPV